jgi:hypothetical protein
VAEADPLYERMLQTLTAALAARVVSGPTVPESCADTTEMRGAATAKVEIIEDLMMKAVRMYE